MTARYPKISEKEQDDYSKGVVENRLTLFNTIDQTADLLKKIKRNLLKKVNSKDLTSLAIINEKLILSYESIQEAKNESEL